MLLFRFIALVLKFAGSYAEYSVVPVEKLVNVPPNISFEQAATSMIQGMTAHYLTYSVYPVGPGTKVLVHAAAGGTGSLICQVAKNAGINPFKPLRDCDQHLLSPFNITA